MSRASTARFCAAVAGAALTLSVVAPAAMAYPPNPTVPQPVGGGVVLVSEATAQKATPSTVKSPPAETVAAAPTVSRNVGAVVALVVTLAPKTTYTTKVKINGKYVDLGPATTDANGETALPAFRPSKPGTYTVAMVDPKTGATSYVKVVIKKRRA